MPLIVLEKTELAFGHFPLLDRADLSVEAGERIALIGRNGAGKSSLLRAIAGQTQLDDGRIILQTGLRLAVVDQEPKFDADDTVYHAVAAGLHEEHALIDEYETLIASGLHDDASMKRQRESSGRLPCRWQHWMQQTWPMAMCHCSITRISRSTAVSGSR